MAELGGRYQCAARSWPLPALLLAPARTRKPYPSRPVTLIVPFPAGGSTDWLSRMLGQKLEQRLKAPFVVENRPGGANVIAAVSVAKSARRRPHALDDHVDHDGDQRQRVQKSRLRSGEGFYPGRARVERAVRAGGQSGAAGEVDRRPGQARQGKPGGLDYASTGPGSAANLYAVLLKNELGHRDDADPLQRQCAGIADTIAGHVSVMFSDVLSALPHIRSGKLRALGVSTRERVPAASELPTLHEAGVPGYDASAWQMIVAPAKTPTEIVERLNAELNAIVREPAVNRDINGRGHIAVVTPPVAELQRFVQAEIVRWAKVVEDAGAKGTE